MFLWSCCHSTGKRKRENVCEHTHRHAPSSLQEHGTNKQTLDLSQSFGVHTAQGNFGCKWRVLTWPSILFTASLTNAHVGTHTILQVPSKTWHNMTMLTSEGDFWHVLGMWGETLGRDMRDTSSTLSDHLLPVSYLRWDPKMDCKERLFQGSNWLLLAPNMLKVVNIVKPLT